jgi:dTDP-4-amino-4,6-dideoxygalactose transaminase
VYLPKKCEENQFHYLQINIKPMIPLSIPNISGNEWTYVKDCLDTGWISSVGSYVTQFENMVAEFAGAKYGVAAMNGTAALHIAQELAGVRQRDYVITPDITFIATAMPSNTQEQIQSSLMSIKIPGRWI